MTSTLDAEATTEVVPRASGRPPGPPSPPRPPRRRRAAGPPPPPRRPPRQTRSLTSRERIVRTVVAIIALVTVAFVAGLVIVSPIHHAVWQQQLGDELRAQFGDGTAPVDEGDFEGVLLHDGDPVALLEIPATGLYEVVVEGSGSAALMRGPGHRRDTILPGQEGVSVLFGRAAAYGGPFGGIERLPIGTEILATTGQGTSTYRVMGIRYAGEPAPAPPGAGEGRLILVSARGLPFVPSGVVYVDAELVGEALPTGARQTTLATLRPSEKQFGVDDSTVWALVFALQFVVAAELALLWVLPRVGPRKAWMVFTPILLLGAVWVAIQLNLLLPNLL